MVFPQATVERPDDAGVTRASNVLVVGSGSPSDDIAKTSSGAFWDLEKGDSAPPPQPGMGEVVLNRQLADELEADVGDVVTVRLPKPDDIPADSPLGEKTDRIRSLPDLTGDCDRREQGLGSIQPASQPK